MPRKVERRIKKNEFQKKMNGYRSIFSSHVYEKIQRIHMALTYYYKFREAIGCTWVCSFPDFLWFFGTCLREEMCHHHKVPLSVPSQIIKACQLVMSTVTIDSFLWNFRQHFSLHYHLITKLCARRQPRISNSSFVSISSPCLTKPLHTDLNLSILMMIKLINLLLIMMLVTVSYKIG